MVSIKGLNKAQVLAALYNGSKPQAFGFIHYTPQPMTEQEAAATIVNQGFSFDYLNGRVMKIDISNDDVHTQGYDQDNGTGAVEGIINALRNTNDVNTETIETLHLENTRQSALFAKSHLDDNPTIKINGNVIEYGLGLSEAKPYIEDKLNDILGDE